MPAYRPEDESATRGFVPIESVTSVGALSQRPDGADEPPPAPAPETGASPPFLIAPEPAWSERTSLFGDPAG